MTGPRVAVLDYGIGNLRSAEKALQRAGADAVLTTDPSVADSADAGVLPGVGAFGACLIDDARRGVGGEVVRHGSPFTWDGANLSPGQVDGISSTAYEPVAVATRRPSASVARDSRCTMRRPGLITCVSTTTGPATTGRR